MYLPQFHSIPENDEFWGKGFTDWLSVRKAEPLFKGHCQPRIPMGGQYYDLSEESSIRKQAALAGKYGIDGWGIYHYWFGQGKNLLSRPAEILLKNKDIDIDFFFAWDNVSWKRSWSRIKGNAWAPKADVNCPTGGSPLLVPYVLGGREEWLLHYKWLLPFFQDSRYTRQEGKPVFVIYHYVGDIAGMCAYWDSLAREDGLGGIFFIFRHDPKEGAPQTFAQFTYEPIFSGWTKRSLADRAWSRAKNILGIKDRLKKYNYSHIWHKILRHAKANATPNLFYGAFVSYDDSPRRGSSGRAVLGSTPELFHKFLGELKEICRAQGKDLIFLTAWNEWGEGAYLEPDTVNGYRYLEALDSGATVLVKASKIVPWRDGVPGIGRANIELVSALLKIDDPAIRFKLYSISLRSLFFDFFGWRLRHFTLPLAYKEKSVLAYALEPFLRKRLLHYDLLHLTDNFDTVYDGENFILTIHDMILFDKDPDTREKFIRAGRLSRFIVTPSEYSKKEIVRLLGVEEEKVKVIPWGVNHDIFYPREEAQVASVLEKYGIRRPFFFSCSTGDRRKNADITLESFSRFIESDDSTSLVLISSPAVAPLKEKYKSAINRGRIVFLDSVPSEDLACLYSGATASYFISSAEGFGFPLLESFACGTPCVSCCNTSLESLGRGYAYFVKERDVEETVESMKHFAAEGKGDTARLIEYARQFRWSETAVKYLEIYKEAAGKV